MAKTKFFRVATSGATTDGRVIDEQTLRDMAATYDPATYQARGNLEHIRGAAPDGAFGAYADVLALKTEPVTLNVGGRQEQRVGLYAQVDTLDPLDTLVGKKQKIFSSIEVTPNFAKTGKAYLTGLAFTDNPASLGTEMMKFCATAGAASPLHFRKSQADAIFAAAEEITLEFDATPAGVPGPNPDPQTNAIIDALRRVFAPFTAAPVTPPATLVPPVTAPTTDPTLLNAFAGLRQVIEPLATNSAAQATQLTQIATSFAALQTETAKLRTDLTASQAEQATLRTALEKLPGGQFARRDPATGGGGDTSLKTDC